jgi:type III secretion protein S
MSPDIALQQLTESMLLVLVLSLPPIIVASVVGIAISLLQALTQVQEQTVSFAIKLIAVAVTIALMAGMLGSEMVNFTNRLFTDFPSMT